MHFFPFLLCKGQCSSDDTIQAALSSYRCPIKVKLLLPCSHEPEMACAEEEEIQSGFRPMPRCDKKAHTPQLVAHYAEVVFFALILAAELAAFEVKALVVTQQPRYVYADCKHTREVTCYQLAEYKRDANKVEICQGFDRQIIDGFFGTGCHCFRFQSVSIWWSTCRTAVIQSR